MTNIPMGGSIIVKRARLSGVISSACFILKEMQKASHHITRKLKTSNDIHYITRNTCIAEPCKAHGEEACKMSGMGLRKRNRFNCVTGEGTFQQLL